MRTNTSTTRIQVFSHQNTVFHQLLKPILRQDFERLVKQYHQGQKLRLATRWDQFIAILMSQLSCRQSLRDIESNLESQQEKLYHLGAKRIARSTLARINEEQPARFCINNCLSNYFNIVKIPRLLINFDLKIHSIHLMRVILIFHCHCVNGQKYMSPKQA